MHLVMYRGLMLFRFFCLIVLLCCLQLAHAQVFKGISDSAFSSIEFSSGEMMKIRQDLDSYSKELDKRVKRLWVALDRKLILIERLGVRTNTNVDFVAALRVKVSKWASQRPLTQAEIFQYCDDYTNKVSSGLRYVKTSEKLTDSFDLRLFAESDSIIENILSRRRDIAECKSMFEVLVGQASRAFNDTRYIKRLVSRFGAIDIGLSTIERFIQDRNAVSKVVASFVGNLEASSEFRAFFSTNSLMALNLPGNVTISALGLQSQDDIESIIQSKLGIKLSEGSSKLGSGSKHAMLTTGSLGSAILGSGASDSLVWKRDSLLKLKSLPKTNKRIQFSIGFSFDRARLLGNSNLTVSSNVHLPISDKQEVGISLGNNLGVNASFKEIRVNYAAASLRAFSDRLIFPSLYGYVAFEWTWIYQRRASTTRSLLGFDNNVPGLLVGLEKRLGNKPDAKRIYLVYDFLYYKNPIKNSPFSFRMDLPLKRSL
jgi:hypothetical protein